MPRLPWHALSLALALAALGLAVIPAAAAAAAVPVVTAKGGATSATVYFTPAATDDHYAIGIFRTSSSGTPINVDSSGNPTGLDIIYTCKSSQSPPGCVPLGGGTVQLPFADYFALPTHEPFPGRYRFKVRAYAGSNTPTTDWSALSTQEPPLVGTGPSVVVGGPAAVQGTRLVGSGTGFTVEFSPAWLADQGYLVEVLDGAGSVVGTLDVAASDLTACAAPVATW